MKFGKSVNEPLRPLEEAIRDGNLGSFTVNRELDMNPTTPPPTISPESTTGQPVEPPSSGARTSGLSDSELWGIIGGCIAFVLLIVIIIIVCCICKKKKSSGGASKSGKSTYSEADGYRMNRQQPPSGLGTASPAYVEARHYAPVNSARRQDDEPKSLNYADLSFNKSSAPVKQPPPYSTTEYSEPSPQKQGGQQEEGFQLWC
ncbi:hypothetical protein OS493_024261 [Desmophyllum pertusum]|uniref:Uncharacterized protein n=1 Tax=Desmophyllum pertusum TaxID=174260 RepID=A0A9W9YY93_9CNID|nr:hypothetical protein OS493_024261 [Desmophyllum pertusum]